MLPVLRSITYRQRRANEQRLIESTKRKSHCGGALTFATSVRAGRSISHATDIAVYGALFALLGLVFVFHRTLSNYFRRKEHRE
jgi:hypothetical protein